MFGQSLIVDHQAKPIFRRFREALRLDPSHRGAHQYIGIAFWNTYQAPHGAAVSGLAEKNLRQAMREYKNISRALAAYKPAAFATVR